MAVTNKTKITQDISDIQRKIQQTGGTVEEVAEVVRQYELLEKSETRIIDGIENHLKLLERAGKDLKNLNEDDIQGILKKVAELEGLVHGIGEGAKELKDLANDLSLRINSILHDSDRAGDFTRSWNRQLGRSLDFVTQIQASSLQGEALSNRQLDRENRRAIQLKLQNEALLESYGILSKRGELERRQSELQGRVNQGIASREDLKQLGDVLAKLNAIEQFDLSNKIVDITERRKVEERSARKIGGPAVGLANAASKLAGKLGFSDISEDIGSLVGDFKQNARIQQSAALAKILRKNGVRLGEDGKYRSYRDAATGKFTKGTEVPSLEPYLKEARRAVDTTGLLGNLWKGISVSVFSAGTALIVFNKLWQTFKEIDKAAVDVQHSIGSWEGAIAITTERLATSKDVLKAIQSITDEYKVNPVHIFSPDELAQIAEAKNLLGLTDQQAAKLGVTSKIAGAGAESFKNNLKAGVRSANELSIRGGKVEQTIVAGGVALREALNATDAMNISMGNNAIKIGGAAQAATALGMTLKDIESISKTLMNFESSISAEMEAQLMTGHQLNLSKAREYALTNNMEGVVREIQRQGMSMADYGRMNFLQQESFAKALGMTRDQYAHLLVQQALSGKMSEAEAKAALGGQYEAIEATKKWEMAVTSLREAFLPIMQGVGWLVGWIGELGKHLAGKIAIGVTLVVAGVTKLVSLIQSAKAVWASTLLVKKLSLGASKAETAEAAKQLSIEKAKTKELSKQTAKKAAKSGVSGAMGTLAAAGGLGTAGTVALVAAAIGASILAIGYAVKLAVDSISNLVNTLKTADFSSLDGLSKKLSPLVKIARHANDIRNLGNAIRSLGEIRVPVANISYINTGENTADTLGNETLEGSIGTTRSGRNTQNVAVSLADTAIAKEIGELRKTTNSILSIMREGMKIDLDIDRLSAKINTSTTTI